MGSLFSRNKQQIIPDEDDEFFDCLNDDDDTFEYDEQNHRQIISHFYAVWIPSNVEMTGKKKTSKNKFLLF